MGKRWLTAAAVLGTLMGATNRPAAAQTYAYLLVGNATYADDPFCLESPAFATHVMAGFSGSLVGVSAQYINNDWPWPDTELASIPGTTAFLTHGSAFQIQAELSAAKFVSESINRHVRPFVGAGLHYSTDGDPASSGQATTYGIKGQTRPYVTYGVMGFVSLGSSRIGVTGGYRGTSVFFGDFELEPPQGTPLTAPGKTLTSGVWTVGFALQVGS